MLEVDGEVKLAGWRGLFVEQSEMWVPIVVRDGIQYVKTVSELESPRAMTDWQSLNADLDHENAAMISLCLQCN